MDEKRFCTKCGAGLKPGDKFCAGCGNRVGETDSTAEHTGSTAGHTGGIAGKNEKENRPQKTGKKIASWASGIGMILLIILLVSGALDGMFYELTDGDFGKGSDNVKTVGNGGGGQNSQNAGEETVTDLYRYRNVTEEVITVDLGFAKDDTGIYPSMDDMTFLCSEGNLYMLSLGESSIGKYSFLGAQVGDNMEQVKGGFEKFFTFESSSTLDDTFRDIYMDNEWDGMLMVEYSMSDGKISGITYTDMSELTGMISDDGMAEEGVTWQDGPATGTDMADLDYGYIYGGHIDHACEIAVKDTSEIEYVLYDVDKDGYDEFFIENDQNMYDVYTTNGTESSFLGSVQCFNAQICEYREGVGFYTDYCQMGYESIRFVTIQNGALVEEIVFEGENENYGYREDGTPYEELSYPVQYHTLGEGLLW